MNYENYDTYMETYGHKIINKALNELDRNKSLDLTFEQMKILCEKYLKEKK
jgi:hypothetical protein